MGWARDRVIVPGMTVQRYTLLYVMVSRPSFEPVVGLSLLGEMGWVVASKRTWKDAEVEHRGRISKDLEESRRM